MTDLHLAQEVIPPDEPEIIAKIVQALQTMYQRQLKAGKPARRFFHPKHIGCVKAEFHVAEDLPEEWRAGVFAKPGVFQAILRFSNGSPRKKSDLAPDLRGLAIKLVGVEGPQGKTTQDFLMITSKTMFVKDLPELWQILEGIVHRNPLAFIFGWNPLMHLPRFFQMFKALTQPVTNPLGAQYWTTTPFLMGKIAAKFSAKPVITGQLLAAAGDENALGEVLAQQLQQGGAEFEFLAQVQTDPHTMPIEDPTLAWDESLSPYRKVASIKIPAQNVNAPAWLEFCEHLSFTPWHCLPEHRPLGGLNRVRQPIYELFAQHRRTHNQAPQAEPTGEERF